MHDSGPFTLAHHDTMEEWRFVADERNVTVCGDGLCRCHDDVADCSSHADGLQYIPQLPKKIRSLNFSHNHLSGIFHDDFFQNATDINRLSLFDNDLTYISPEAFRALWNLRSLLLNFNVNLNFSTLVPVLYASALQQLELSDCKFGQIPQDYFSNSSWKRLETLMLYDNNIGDTNLSVFRPLSSLRSLGLANNKISRLSTDTFSALTFFNLNANTMYLIPQTCRNGNESLFPNLTHLLLKRNIISSIGDICLPKLRVLELGENKFWILPPYGFSGQKLPQLIELYLHSMESRLSKIHANAFNNPSLQRIALTYDYIEFGHDTVEAKIFVGCPSLEDLQISHNFVDISENRFLRLFGHLTNMKYLYIENAGMHTVTRRMFSGFPLLRNLSLNRNLLAIIPDNTFGELSHLRHVDLGENQILVVTQDMFNAATRKQLSFIDLSGNPFMCTCDILWFKRWLVANATLFKQSWTTYDCHNLPNTSLQYFHLPAQACMLSQSASIIIIGSVSLVIVTLTVVFSVFRFRWHLRLLLYEAFRGRGDIRRRRLEVGYFDYDIFVSYDTDDLPWVRQHLMLQLEGQLGLRLCVHERDFIIGRNIVNNIADSVERSKKVMMLFSNSFVQRQWCQFELTFCLSHVMDYDDELIIVCLDDVTSRELTGAMMAVLKTTTYIQWVNDADAIASFWGRLGIALQEVINNEHALQA